MKNNYVIKAFLGIMKHNIIYTVLLAITACGVVITSLIPPQILKKIIDDNLTIQNKEGLLRLAMLYFVMIILIGVFDFLKEAILTVLGQKITSEIRYAMMEKMARINPGFFTVNGTGVTVSRFMNDVDAINSMFTNGIVGMVIDCLKVIGIVLSIWFFQVQLGLITMLLLPVIYFITRSFQKKMLKAQVKNRILISKVNNHIGESIKNIMTVKMFSKEDYMEAKYTEYLSENYKTIEKVNFYDSIFPPIIQITRAIVIGLIVILASNQLGYLGITLGMVAASIDLISNLFAPLEQLGMEFQSIQQAISGIRRVNDFMKEQEDNEKNEDYIAEIVIPRPYEVELEFHNVSFYYDEGTEILQNINLRIHPLEKVAFAGRTGVGKSTLFKLILGLLKPKEGSITINGVDVSLIPNSQKRRIFGYVEQGFSILNGTIAEQISLQDDTITKEQIKDSIEFVGMSDYIGRLEQGMDTPVLDTTFSQGQKQLMSIARAIVTDPPILLLDEITANLDSITEERILSVLQRAGRKRTILSISHRLSSLVDSDTVVILENGRIKNSGSPEVLMKCDEWYRSHLALENLTWS